MHHFRTLLLEQMKKYILNSNQLTHKWTFGSRPFVTKGCLFAVGPRRGYKGPSLVRDQGVCVEALSCGKAQGTCSLIACKAKSSLGQTTVKPPEKGHTIWLQGFGGRKALPAGRGGEGFWEEVGEEWSLEGWSDFTGGWWSIWASTGVGWSKVGFGDSNWPGRLERRVI